MRLRDRVELSATLRLRLGRGARLGATSPGRSGSVSVTKVFLLRRSRKCEHSCRVQGVGAEVLGR